jgi:hypothetical protein
MNVSIKRFLSRLKRIRYCCGFGIHSPFAFQLITQVIYERSPYYAYAEIEQARPSERGGAGSETRKVKRLLFRLVNRFQPAVILEIGAATTDTSLYLKRAKTGADYYPAVHLLPELQPVDFVYVHYQPDLPSLREKLDDCLARVTSASVLVLSGIGYTGQMKCLWKELQKDDRVGVTFDLYDVGILFFDKKMIKQHYIVNF